jgi:hypothetical protein
VDHLLLLSFLAVPAVGFLALTSGIARMAAVRDLPRLGFALWLLPAFVYAVRMVQLVVMPSADAITQEMWLFELSLALRDWVVLAGATWLVLLAAGIASRITARA